MNVDHFLTLKRGLEVQATFNGTLPVGSVDMVMVDGNPYFPRASMKSDLLQESGFANVCSWKGRTRYWHVVVGDQVISNVVWAYKTPKFDAEAIRKRFAFERGNGIELR